MKSLTEQMSTHPDSATALIFGSDAATYGELRAAVDVFAQTLLGERADLDEERIAMLLPSGRDYVVALLGIWRAGGVAVPLSTAAAEKELEYALRTARATRRC